MMLALEQTLLELAVSLVLFALLLMTIVAGESTCPVDLDSPTILFLGVRPITLFFGVLFDF